MTSEQASKKWCPMVIASHTNPRQASHLTGEDFQHNCIGSACMMWRLDGAMVKVADDHYEESGYCGLAPIVRQPD